MMNTCGDIVQHFEDKLAVYCGSKYAVAVDCCTHAIFLSLSYVKNHHGGTHYVEVPKQTYISVPMMAIHAGYKIKFVDIDWSGCYKLRPVDVIDSACRLTKNMYSSGTLQCLSFGNKKLLSTGKGGAILTDDIEAVAWLKQMRFSGRPCEMYMDMKDVTILGWHMQMIPEVAARGIEQLISISNEHNDDFGQATGRPDISNFTVFNKHKV